MAGTRPRINKTEAKGVPVEDPLEFKANLGSQNAREIKTLSEHISIELWFDYHYLDRNQNGDGQGKREGITPENVEQLVLKSFKHLMFYSARIKGFSFLNHENGDSPIRTILRDSKQRDLTVVVQAHYKNFNKYQFTVITARCDEFRIGSGQYFVELEDESCSTLKRIDNGKEVIIFTCQD